VAVRYEVQLRFAGKDFVHPLCGSILRMSLSREGEPDIELISTPELEEKAAVDLDAISKSESHGLFLPRHLCEHMPLHGGTSVAQSSGVQLSAGESPGKASARFTKALSKPSEGTGNRVRKVRLARDTSNPSHLRERLSRTVDDLSGDVYQEKDLGSPEPASQSRQPGNETVSMPGTGRNSDTAMGEMSNDTRKFVGAGFVLMVLVAVMFMMADFVLGDSLEVGHQ
jgi:hypothetical protein